MHSMALMFYVSISYLFVNIMLNIELKAKIGVNFICFHHQVISFTTTIMFLTHLPLVPHICVNESGQCWIKLWLVAYWAPSYYLKQCRLLSKGHIGTNFQWNFDNDTKPFMHKNASGNIICEMVARGRWVDTLAPDQPQLPLVKHILESIVLT